MAQGVQRDAFKSKLQSEFSRVGKTALPLIYYRSFSNIPYAKEMSDLLNAEQAAKEIHGDDLKEQLNAAPIMEARYKGGAIALERFIANYPDAQVLEIAAGFSLHGTFLSQKYPSVRYIETDADKNTVHIKEELIHFLLGDGDHSDPADLEFKTLNLVSDEGVSAALELIDPKRPLVIYCEGLLSYLNDKEKHALAGNIKKLLAKSSGVWITPDPAMSAERRNRLAGFNSGFNIIKRTAETLTGQKYDDHGFGTEADADRFFEQENFALEKVSQPINLDAIKNCNIEKQLAKEIVEDVAQFGKVWILSI
jgi:O-methyltransferase involved in polyketide biosynthesis